MAVSPTKEGDGQITLKALLQDPFQLLPKSDDKPQQQDKPNDGVDIQADSEKQKAKEKELELDFDPLGNVNPMSAFLGPKLWDDSMLYGDENLKFEFMDIDEFLNEHGILGNDNKAADKEKNSTDSATEDADADAQLASVVEQTVSPQDVISMVMGDEAEQTTVTDSLPSVMTTSPAPSTPPRELSPVNVDINFELSHTDVALATIPGEETYDPRSKQFTDEELKPQPMIKKSKKVFVPDEQKDGKYWERRRKNNIAAKRSRDARRVKENQIVLRAAYLEKLNGALKGEVVDLKKENMSLKSVVQKLEKELKEAMVNQLL